MCRLFALHAGQHDVAAEFWLLQAPDSLAKQSEVNADGFGIAAFTSADAMLLVRNPVRAATDAIYTTVSQKAQANQFVAHLRYMSTGEVSLRNTHPFVQDNRIFAHNGVLGDLPKLEQRLGDGMSMVGGDTDSERYFALITLAIRDAGGDVRAGIKAAVTELVEGYELYAINFLLAEPGHLWAFRYPEKNTLMLLEKAVGGEPLVEDGPSGTLHLHTNETLDHPVVIVASEKMDAEPGWEPIESGELVHIGPDMSIDREIIVTGPPKHQMVLQAHEAASQSFERDTTAA